MIHEISDSEVGLSGMLRLGCHRGALGVMTVLVDVYGNCTLQAASNSFFHDLVLW